MELNLKQSFVKVVLRGGIGNQLFQYFAGLDLATQSGLKLLLEDSLIQERRIRNQSIHSLEIQADFTQDDISLNRLRLQRITDALQFRSLHLNSYLSPITKRNIINSVGFDSRVYTNGLGLTLVGYFQTWKHFENSPLTARESIFTYFLELKEIRDLIPSSLTKRVIGVHIRRGDYVSLRDTFGIIGNTYYKLALNYLDFNSSKDELWIFTDGSLDEVHQTLNLGEVEYKVFTPKTGLSDVEQLALMSQLKYLIIANSTFSWWAGALSAKSSTIIAPLRWYRNMPEPNCLIPSTWIQIENQWEV